MFAVIIPFVSKQVASDWGNAVRALERTLKSILSNQDSDLHVFIVCQDDPQLKNRDHRYTYIKSNNPIPDKNDIMAKNFDRGHKVSEGFSLLSQYNPNYVMFCDADDLVSNRLVSYVKSRPSFDAFCFQSGYVWREGTQHLTKIPKFHKVCGSSFVMRYNDRVFPGWLKGDWENMIGELAHNQIAETMEKAGLALNKIDIPMAVYVTGHGNHLWEGFHELPLTRRIKDLLLAALRRRHLTDILKEEFGIQ